MEEIKKTTTIEKPKVEQLVKKPIEEQQPPKQKIDPIVELTKSLKQARKDIDLLKSISDKKALSLYYQRNKENLPTIVKLRVLDGKVIIGWKTIVDEVYQDSMSRRWIEKQIISVLFEDGTAKELALTDFYRTYTSIPCIRKGIITDEHTGDTSIRLARQDTGKEYVVGVQFVN